MIILLVLCLGLVAMNLFMIVLCPYKRLSLVRRQVAGGTYKEQQQQRSDDDSLQGEKGKREIRITALTLRSLLQDRFITVTILQGT